MKPSSQWYEIPEWVLFTKDLDQTDKSILCLLIAYDKPNKEGFRKEWVTVSQTMLASLAGIHRTTVATHLRHLEKRGIVKVGEWWPNGARRISIRYFNEIQEAYLIDESDF